MSDKFFVHALIKDVDNFTYRAAFQTLEGNDILFAQLESSEIKLPGVWHLQFYMGPKQLSVMSVADPRLEQLLDYGIFSPIIKIVLPVLDFFHKYFKSYGLAIILLTLLIRLLMLPFTLKGQLNMERMQKSQSEMQKKLQYLKQKYKNDPERFRQEQAELYKKDGMGNMLGCLPLLLQIPIFIVLNRLFTSSIEMYHTSFLWIPNLSAPDPYYVLPVLTGLGMLLNTLVSKKQKQGKGQIGGQFGMYAIALIFGTFMTGLASGVVIFIVTSIYLGVLEAWLVKIKK